MALTYFGVDDFQITGPPQWRPSLWDLDTLIVPYSGPVYALEGFLDGLTKGTAYADDSAMFLVDFPIQNADKHYPSVDLIYMGKRGGVLPPQKPTSGGQITSATSNTGSDIFPATYTNPVTVTFYAITRTLTFISDDPDDASEPDDPPEITSLISWDLGFGALPGNTFPEYIDILLNNVFQQYISEVPPSVEPLVPDEYYRISKSKTRSLLPYAPPS